MKVRMSLSKRCIQCRILRRHGISRIICLLKKHNQRQKKY